MTSATALPSGLHVFERGWLSSNNVLFEGASGTVLVDTGYVTHATQTAALVQSVLGPRSLDRVLNTHLHSDHCGGNALLQAIYPDLVTAIPSADAAAARNWDEDVLSYRATGQECPQFRFDELLEPGRDVLLGDRRWQVHAAPGHNPHAVVLFEPSTRILISADALWEHGFGVVFPELVGEPSFEDVAATLDLIDSLQPTVVIPGHGRIFEDVHGALRASRSRLSAFVQSPQRHARHALKVLIKFKLLAVQSLSVQAYNDWLVAMPYATLVRDRFFPDLTLTELGAELASELVRANAARQMDGVLLDA